MTDCKRTAYVGDEYKSEILFRQKTGRFPIFVNTGMDKDRTSKIEPDVWLNSAKDLLGYI